MMIRCRSRALASGHPQNALLCPAATVAMDQADELRELCLKFLYDFSQDNVAIVFARNQWKYMFFRYLVNGVFILFFRRFQRLDDLSDLWVILYNLKIFHTSFTHSHDWLSSMFYP